MNYFNAVSKLTLLLFIVSTVVLPSGSVFDVNIKILATIFLVLIIFLDSFKTALSVSLLLSPLAVMFFLIFYSLLGYINGVQVGDLISQASGFLALFSAVYLPIFMVSTRKVAAESVVRWIMFSYGAVCALKIIMQVIMVFWMDFNSLRNLLEGVFGKSFIGLDAGWYYRIHFPSDYLAPIVIYALLLRKKLTVVVSGFVASVLLCLVTISVVLSYSRYLWVYSIIAFVLALMANKFNIKIIIAFFLFLFLVTLLSLIFGGALMAFVAERYFGDFSASSDGPRAEMVHKLIEQISQTPWMGLGLGAGVPGYTHIEEFPWYFELQWIGLAIQLGLMGAVLLFLCSLSPLLLYAKPPVGMFAVGGALLYGLWLLLGFFNGFMLTGVGGIIFSIYILFPKIFAVSGSTV